MDSTPSDARPPKESAVSRAQHGDVDAFGDLYREHAGRVFALCVRMSGDRIHAQELMQDVFVRAWERLASFRGDASFESWLHRLAVNVVLTGVRTDRRREVRVTLAEDLAAVESGSGWSGRRQVADPGTAIDIERAIAALPPGARSAFVLHDVEGFSHAEIAELTGLAEGTIRAQLHRARKLLMEALG
ncbi:MAG: RNA polymerase sigma factor [Gemmatimonadota bacterium]|nr:RNA polymerase sigma factor [Gemmatimonadota bacterium]